MPGKSKLSPGGDAPSFGMAGSLPGLTPEGAAALSGPGEDFASFEDLGLSAEAARSAEAKAARQVARAEKDLEARVNFRWGRTQVGLVKRAAAAAGVPYQIYIKQVLYERAISDLERSRALG